LESIQIKIEECSLEINKWIVTDEKSLDTAIAHHADDVSINSKQLALLDDKYNTWALSMQESIQSLCGKLQQLMELKKEILDNNIKGNKNLSDYLCDKCEINKSDKHGFLPLHYASMINDVELAIKLMRNGGKTNIRNIRLYEGPTHSSKAFMVRLNCDFVRLFRVKKLVDEKGMNGIALLGMQHSH
ncbi:MAG: hypothetical protein ACYCQI_16225, partial [Gammaproteobacteria bacterium]